MPSVDVREFNSANTEDRVQIQSSTNSLMVYSNGGWREVSAGSSPGNQSKALAGTTTPLLAETVPLWAATANTTALSTGVMTSTAIYLSKGTVVTKLGWFSGTTAESVPAHAWAALYDTSATPALIGQSTDDTSHTWAARTLKTFTLATPYTVATNGVYYASLMLAATVPTLQTTAATSNALINTGANYGTGAFDRCVTSGSSLTTTAPATVTSTTVVTTIPYVAVF